MVLSFVSMIPDPPAMRGGGGLALHPLDVCHRSLLHGSPPRPCHTGRREEFVPSATELDQAGVRFRPSRTRSLHDISFRHGALRIPRLAVDDTTEHKLFSLMAFEQLHGAGANEVTAYRAGVHQAPHLLRRPAAGVARPLPPRRPLAPAGRGAQGEGAPAPAPPRRRRRRP